MPDAGSKTLLVKFRGDLRDLKGTMGDIVRSVEAMQKQIGALRTRTKAEEAKDAAVATAGEKKKLAEAQAIVKAGAGRAAQEKSLQASIAHTLEMYKQQTLELKKQVAELRSMAEAHVSVARNVANVTRQTQATQRGVIPTLARNAAVVGSTMAGATGATTGQESNQTAIQAMMARNMRMQQAGGGAGVSGTAATMVMGGGGADAKAISEMRARQLRQAKPAAATPEGNMLGMSVYPTSVTEERKLAAAQRRAREEWGPEASMPEAGLSLGYNKDLRRKHPEYFEPFGGTVKKPEPAVTIIQSTPPPPPSPTETAATHVATARASLAAGAGLFAGMSMEGLQAKAKATAMEIAAVSKATIEARMAGNREEVVALQKILLARREESALIRQEIAEVRQRNAQDQEKKGGGILSTLGRGLGGMFGGGPVGTIIGAIVGGEFAVEGVKGLVEGLGEIAHKIQEVVTEAGPLQQLNAQFDHLAAARGTNTIEFMDKLKEATRGLVPSHDLLQAATGAMRSNLKLTDDQIVKLISDTTELARVQGKSVPQAIQIASRSVQSGQLRGLGRYLGLNLQEMGMGAAPRYATIQEREQLQYQQITSAMESRTPYKTGIAPATVNETMQRMQTAWHDITEEFGQGLVTSPGAKAFMDQLDKMVEKFGGLEKVARNVGTAMGEGLAVVGSLLNPIVAGFGALASVVELALKPFGLVDSAMGSIRSAADATETKFAAMHPVLYTITTALNELTLALNLLQDALDNAKDHFSDFATGAAAGGVGIGQLAVKALKAVPGAVKDWSSQGAFSMFQTQFPMQTPPSTKPETSQQRHIREFNERQQQMAEAFTQPGQGLVDSGKGKTGPQAMDPAVRAALMKQAEDQLTISQTINKERLALQMDELDKERTAEEQFAKAGTVTQNESLEKRKDLLEQERQFKMDQLQADFDATVAFEQRKLKLGESNQVIYLANIKKASVQTGEAKLNANLEIDKKERTLGVERSDDAIAASKKLAESQFSSQQAALELQRSATKDSFDKGLIDTKTYLEQETQYYSDELDRRKAVAEQQFQETKGTGYGAALAQRTSAIQAAKDWYAQQIQTQQQLTPQTALQGAQVQQQQFTTTQAQVQAQHELLQTQRGGQGPTAQEQQRDLKALIDAQVTSIQKMQDALSVLNPLNEAQVTQWQQIATMITQARTNLQQFQSQLQTVQSSTQSILTAAGGIAAGLGAAPQGRTRGLAGTAQLPQLMSLADQQMSAEGGGPFASSVTNLVSLFQSLFTSISSLPEMFSNLSESLKPVLQLGAGAATAIGQGPVAGAIGTGGLGGVIGTGFGALLQKFGNLLSGGQQQMQGQPGQPVGFVEGEAPTGTPGVIGVPPTQSVASGAGGIGGAVGSLVGKAVSSISSVAGPIGAIAGEAFGAILSSIIGAKQEKEQTFLYNVSLQMQQVSASMQSGQIGLNQAIQEAITLRNSVEEEMSSASKKKAPEFQQAIQGLNQQVLNLQAQQTSLLNQLQEGVQSLAQSPPFQEFISQLQQIVQQYTQFAGAATNAQQLAQANQYLVESLQQFASTEMNQMNQAETQAVQDAINLNDLYQQRQTLLQQMADQEQSIMGQGILTRQTTTAQSKMEQIALIQQQNTLELQNLNEQISAAQFRVDAEKQIFNLATTRVGLEAQLLQLQNNSTLLDMARIAALQQVVIAMQSGNFAQGITSGINLANFPGLQAFENLMNSLGFNSSNGSFNLEQSFFNMFNQQSSYTFGGFSIVGGGG